MDSIQEQLNNRLTLNVDELAKIIGLSKWTIYTLSCQGKIPHVKVGRRVLFPVKAIEKWLDENTIYVVER